MAVKTIAFGQDARDKIKKGVSKLSKAVRVTLGPRGRNVILQRSYGAPTVTKDGVTVSKEIELPDPFENMGAKMVNEAASKTSDIAGDGTTTATVLARAIFREIVSAARRKVKTIRVSLQPVKRPCTSRRWGSSGVFASQRARSDSSTRAPSAKR